MIEIQEEESIVCAEPDCNKRIEEGAVFYIAEDENGNARAICAGCRDNKMNILESAFAAKKAQRDEAQESLRKIAAELSRLTSAKKEDA